MSDLFEPLREREAGYRPAADPAAIRARGDRIRHRRATLQVVGAATAVALVVGGVAFAGDLVPEPGRTPQVAQTSTPAPSPTVAAPASLPDLPLTSGWDPKEGRVRLDGVLRVDPIAVCGANPYVERALDRRAAEREAAGATTRREVLLFPDVRTADAAMRYVVSTPARCQSGTATTAVGGPAGLQRRSAIVDAGEGAGGVLVWGAPVDTASRGLDLLLGTRIGNAVALTYAVDADSAAVQADYQGTLDGWGDTLRVLCGTYGGDGCSSRVSLPPIAKTPTAPSAPADPADPVDPVDPASPSAPPEVVPALEPADLLGLVEIEGLAGELNQSHGYSSWQRTITPEIPTLSCQRDWLSSLAASSSTYSEHVGRDDGGTVSSRLTLGALRFDSRGEALTAYETVRGWMRACSAEDLEQTHEFVSAEPIQEGAVSGSDASAVLVVDRHAPEFPEGSKGLWVDEEGAALVGDTVVLVGLGRLDDARMSEVRYLGPVLDAAIGKVAR